MKKYLTNFRETKSFEKGGGSLNRRATFLSFQRVRASSTLDDEAQIQVGLQASFDNQ